MGQTLITWFMKVFSVSKPSRIVMVGLDNAGKSTILNDIKGESHPTIPTVGFNVETLEINNITVTIWDLGGQESGTRNQN
jgi:small GTP-binding protein